MLCPAVRSLFLPYTLVARATLFGPKEMLTGRPIVLRASNEWPEGTEIWIAGLDESVNERGMIRPGLGDVGDRLFLTIGK